MKIESFEPIIEKLIELGCNISESIIQDDIIFGKQELGSEGRNILRIRKSNNEYLFTLKRDITDELDCIEKEIKINDPDVMKEIIELLGYFEVIKVNKKRIRCKYKDYEICLDDVENLGFFVEIEKFSDNDAESVRKELTDFLESLGIDLSGRVLQGYDTMLEQKESRNKIKKFHGK